MHTKEQGIELRAGPLALWYMDSSHKLLKENSYSLPCCTHNKKIMNGYEKEKRHKNWTCWPLCFVLFCLFLMVAGNFWKLPQIWESHKNEEYSRILLFFFSGCLEIFQASWWLILLFITISGQSRAPKNMSHAFLASNKCSKFKKVQVCWHF